METSRQKAVRILSASLERRKDIAQSATYDEAKSRAYDGEHKGAFYLDLIAIDNSLADAWIRAKEVNADTEQIERKFIGEVAPTIERMTARAEYLH
jgi:hypothetical protein